MRGKMNIWLLILTQLCIMTSCGRSETMGELLSSPAQGEVQGFENVEESLLEEHIWVHVCGQVAMPGVYELLPGSRINDAIEAAGGFMEEADQEALNLAATIEDGQKVYVPARGEEPVISEAEDDRVDINHAREKELQQLPGIGESRARAIVEYRDKNGSFGTIEDLLKVDGIKQSVYDKIKDYIVVR